MTACGTVEQEFSAPTSGAKGPGFRHEAERINAAHAAVVAAERDALRHAVRAGALLEAMKGRLGHGRFLPWIAEHCDFGDRTAQLYMQLARELGKRNPKRVSDLTLRAAIALLRVPAQRPPWLRPSRCLVIRVAFGTSAERARYFQLLRQLRAVANPVPVLLRGLELQCASAPAAGAA